MEKISNLLTIVGILMTSPAQATSLHEAISNNDLNAFKNIISSEKKESLLELRDEIGRTPLLLSTQLNRIEMARILIKNGADVNARDAKQDTPYLFAGAEGRNEILLMTLEHGADLKSTNRYGGTALIPAAEKGHLETVKILLKTKINVNHINRLGWTALLEAIILSDGGKTHQDIIRELIKGGADISIPDKDGVSPLQHAQKRNHNEIVELLKNAGAKKMEHTNSDQSFLEQAIELAIENKAKSGRPFGAIIVKDNKVIASGVNNMLATFDPSSHAELEAIRKATASIRGMDLTGYKIYASAQPCPMCLAAIAMTNISEIIYAFDNNDAAPFNYSSKNLYDKLRISEITFIKMSEVQTKYSAVEVYNDSVK
ncbi:MAG: ankyrin repeat domain-containing protein [Bacteriovoracaceae bacterium]|nr:ankyrin repeat domain-containing protein [Bacteriovoracaceae bacterium]